MIASSERLMHSEALVEELKDQSHDLASRKSQLVLPLSPAVVARLNRLTGPPHATHFVGSIFCRDVQWSEPRVALKPFCQCSRRHVPRLQRRDQGAEGGGVQSCCGGRESDPREAGVGD